MKPVFQFREGCHVRGDAQVVGERLESIRALKSALTPELVLADAREAASPLHAFFEWDDAVAAERYRIDQAGHLIRSVVVTFEEAEPSQPRQIHLESVEQPQAPPPRPVRAFLPVKGEDGASSYVPTSEAMSDAVMRQQVLARAHTELDTVARKWRELRELSDVFSALDRVGALLHSSEGQPQ